MFDKPCQFPCFLFIIFFFNQNFQVQTKLNQAILTFIATQVLTSQDKDEIRKTFQALDKDCDGFLSSEELIEGINLLYIQKFIFKKNNNSIGFSKLYKDKVKAKQEVDRIFKVLGSENNKIDYTGNFNNFQIGKIYN